VISKLINFLLALQTAHSFLAVQECDATGDAIIVLAEDKKYSIKNRMITAKVAMLNKLINNKLIL
jgi:hypothetical protein